jgi:hypothetical protein
MRDSQGETFTIQPQHVNVQLDEIYIAIGSRHLIEISTNVGKTIINHPQFHHK